MSQIKWQKNGSLSPPKDPWQEGFDTYIGKGKGSYNGVEGTTATWKFTDAGEPGNEDTAEISITDVDDNVVLSIWKTS